MDKIYIEQLDNIKRNNNIPSSFLDHIKNYHNEKRYEESLKAYSLLTNKLINDFNLNLDNEELVFNEYKKPFLKVNKNIFFNISHSHGMIALIISDKECGIDIELINNKINTNIINKYLSLNEKNEFYKDPSNIDYLFKMWTVKEAYFKKIGTGLNYNLLKDDLDFSNIKSQKININDKEYYISYDM